MFGIGGPEMIAIFIIALIVFGPKKLPELGKSLGRGLREFNKAKDDLKATWDQQLREAENQIQSEKEAIHEPVRETIASLNATNPVHPENVFDAAGHTSTHPANTELPADTANGETRQEPPVPPISSSGN